MPGSHQTVEQPQHALACMEIWGGNETIDNCLSAPGIDAWVYSLPHEGDTAGGDIHYVSMCGAGNIARFVIADVSGHGSLVAEAARTLRGLMRKNINTLDNTRFTRALNESFQMAETGGKYATAVLATYFAPSDELILVNAGHPRPVLFSTRQREWRTLTAGPELDPDSSTNLPLGIITPTEFEQFSLKLHKGDLVLLYTDGLMEARNSAGHMLGEDGLRALLATLDHKAPDTIIPRLLEAVVHYQEGRPIDDDVTVLLLHHNASRPPKYSVKDQLLALAKTVGLIRV